MKRIPFYPFLFSIFSPLALLANNIVEVEYQVVIRPLLISLALSIGLFFVLGLILRDWHKDALITGLILVLFYSYGQVYDFLQNHPVLGFNFGRHRILIIFYIIFMMIGGWLILKKVSINTSITYFLNFLSIFLLIYPFYRVISFTIGSDYDNKQGKSLVTSDQSISLPNNPPDIYYIITDSYTRADALQKSFHFDNSAFLTELRSLGFYVADCSRANYNHTKSSLSSSLNMEYLLEIKNDLKIDVIKDGHYASLIQHSLVRTLLENVGYKTISFDTDFSWSRLKDAYIFYTPDNSQTIYSSIQPFETMFLKSTAFLIGLDAHSKVLQQTIQDIKYPFSHHLARERLIVEKLPRIPDIRGPKFVFVHIIIPHFPFIFTPDGQFQTDPGYYSGKGNIAINEEYKKKGYLNQVQFDNNQLLVIIKTLLADSKTPPIIIIQGDHGLNGENRFVILNAYYLPGNGNALLYPQITPVNTFRVIFNTYFGSHFELLPDISYGDVDGNQVVGETYPACAR